MTRDEIMDLAREAVSEMRDRAMRDPASMRRGPAPIEKVAARLSGLLSRTTAINPQYAPMAEASASVMALSALDPDAYGRLLGEIARDAGMLDTGTLRGMEFMDGFLSGIGDDHSWSADPDAEPPVIRLQDDLARHAPTLTPRSLLELVEPMLPDRHPSP